MIGHRPLQALIAMLLTACGAETDAQPVEAPVSVPAPVPVVSCTLHIVTGGYPAYSVSEDVMARISRLSSNSGMNIDGFSIVISALDRPAQTAILRDVDWPSLLPIAGQNALFFNEEYALDKLAPPQGCTFSLIVQGFNYTGGGLGMRFSFKYIAAGNPRSFDHDGSHAMTLGPEFSTRDGNTILAVENLMREFQTGAINFTREARQRMEQGPPRRRR